MLYQCMSCKTLFTVHNPLENTEPLGTPVVFKTINCPNSNCVEGYVTLEPKGPGAKYYQQPAGQEVRL